MSDNIQETITELVSEALILRGITAKPSPDMSLIDSNLLDSLSIVTFVGKLEIAFDITISMSDLTLENFDSIQLITELVKLKKLSRL